MTRSAADSKQASYPETRFGGFSGVDGTIAFYLRVNALLEPGFVVVDAGCGRGKYAEDPVPLRRDLRILRGKVSKVIGLDLDEGAAGNPFLDEFHLLREDRWPLEDASVDLCVADYVLEHLEQPGRFFSEARRVVRPGGLLCLRTPNSWSYVALFARLIPNRAHARVTAKVQSNRQEVDVFPTFYRCNSLPRLRSALAAAGFDGVVYGHTSEPAYLSFSPLVYRLGVLAHRLTPAFLSPALLSFARRTDET